ETIELDGRRIELDTNRYPSAVSPRGYENLSSFSLDPMPTFVYDVEGVRLRKTITAIHGENTTVLLFEVLEAPAAIALELRPLLACRDYHALSQANGAIRVADASFKAGVFRARPYDRATELFVQVNGASFTAAPDWYFRFEYAREAERGLDAHEDLFCHGVFRRELAKGGRFGVIVSTG